MDRSSNDSSMTTHTTICKFQYNDIPSHKPLPSSFGKRKITNFDFFDYCSKIRTADIVLRSQTSTQPAEPYQKRLVSWSLTSLFSTPKEQ